MINIIKDQIIKKSKYICYKANIFAYEIICLKIMKINYAIIIENIVKLQ
jgi:hypothetical protein